MAMPKPVGPFLSKILRTGRLVAEPIVDNGPVVFDDDVGPEDEGCCCGFAVVDAAAAAEASINVEEMPIVLFIVVIVDWTSDWVELVEFANGA
jgi:hypothetical protein